jgi:hypothetical protein
MCMVPVLVMMLMMFVHGAIIYAQAFR